MSEYVRFPYPPWAKGLEVHDDIGELRAALGGLLAGLSLFEYHGESARPTLAEAEAYAERVMGWDSDA